MLTQERLKELLHYDPETGFFTRIKSTCNVNKVGVRCGALHHSGYIELMVDSKNYRAHRIAWLYMTGEFPKHYIDHINGVKNDNRFCNLRDVTKQTNAQNEIRARKHNSTKFLGVSKRGNKFHSTITINGKHKHLGFFNTAEEAHAAYIEAKRIHHLGCTI